MGHATTLSPCGLPLAATLRVSRSGVFVEDGLDRIAEHTDPVDVGLSLSIDVHILQTGREESMSLDEAIENKVHTSTLRIMTKEMHSSNVVLGYLHV
jgi:hypothetical protein